MPEDAGNILQVAVNRLLKGVKTKQASGIFATQNVMTASPLGSPIAESPQTLPALTLEEWLLKHLRKSTGCREDRRSQNHKVNWCCFRIKALENYPGIFSFEA